MQKSKTSQPRHWVKWYSSGAVRQPKLGGTHVTVTSVGYFSGGPLEGKYVELTLEGSHSIFDVLVPMSREYNINDTLPEVPANAIPSNFIKYPLGKITSEEAKILANIVEHD